jgi:autotransporter adhesin
MTTGGIDAGSQVISNVTSGGSTLSNAANIFDVQTAAAAAKTEVVAGTNVSVTNVPGGSGQNVYTIDAEKTTVSTTSPGLTVVGTPNSSTNVTDYAVDLSAGTVTSLGLADSAIQTVETQINGTAVKTITKSNNTANFTNVGSGNIVLSDNGGAINVDTAPILNLTSVITGGSTLDTNGLVNGNTTLNGSGVSIAGGPSMTTGGIYAGNQVITGVANGTAPNHAVNFGQLTTLGYRVDDVEDDANAGISSAMAMASLPQPYLSGKSMISGAMGTYNSEGAMAIGVSAITQDGRWVIKASASVDTQSNFGGSVGAGYQF